MKVLTGRQSSHHLQAPLPLYCPPSLSASGLTNFVTSNKRRKWPRQDNGFAELIDTIMTSQSKSDERMLELEEKRLQMEERQFERETQHHMEDQRFQLQMMRLLMLATC